MIPPQMISAPVSQARKSRLDRHRAWIDAQLAEGHTNASIAERLVVTGGAVEKHVRNVFMKLGLPQTEQQHRRVLAVLTYLGV